jgi:2-polyprenyl-3-methyl-5-hydroxy-6-metoxy-1,4-benzoquinol methylase
MEPHALYSKEIARAYDLLVYSRLDVEADEAEMKFLRRAFDGPCRRPVTDVLDVGCGTGRHVVPLARDGYRVTGLDNSEGMLAECRRKLERHGLSADLRCADMADLDAEAEWDAVLCMNSIICYLLDARRIVGLLRRLLRALRPGGLLVVDNWNFFAQWYRLDEDYAEVREAGGIRIDYHDRHWYEDFASVYHVDIDATVRENGRVHQFTSRESLRAMTVGETRLYLEAAGLELLDVYPSFDLSLAQERSGDRMVFLAVRPL